MAIVQWLVYLFFFLLPIQLGKHFFLPFSFINGLRIDYLAPTLYLTDIIALLIIFFQIKNISLKIPKKYVILLILMILNITVSLSPFVTIYKFLKFLEIIFIYYCLDIKLEAKKILIVLTLSALIQLILVTLQIYFGESIQGFFYFLGERYFTLSTPGIAKIIVNGLEVLRAYGTFSHPNSLAGFYLLLYAFVLYEKRFNKFLIIKYSFLGIAALLVFMSFSKVAIITFLVINSLYVYKNVTCKLCSIARIGLLLILSGIFFTFQGDPASATKRIQLMKDSLHIILEYPFFGTGFGAYLMAQSTFPNLYSYYFLQPVHNIFLLLLAELGIPLFYVTTYFVLRFVKKIMTIKVGLILIAVIVFTGLFDHYWLTLQQNIVLLPVVFGLLKNQKWS